VRKSFSVLLFTVLSLLATNSGASPLVNPKIMQMTMKVHVCEESAAGWHVHGPTYFGGLGWLDATWLEFRLPGFPIRADLASPAQQARAMSRFASRYGWPDQNGLCEGY
jgi:hypothetical protein